MIRLASLIVLGTIAANAAWAASPKYSATLATAVTEAKEVIANGNLFRCEGTACVLASPPVDPSAMSTCRQLAHAVGEIKAFGTEKAMYDADKLAHCNAK